MKEIVKRYLVFITGLYFLSAGIVLIVKSTLGTTPISCLNYVISVNTPLSLGMATFIFNVLLIILQFMLINGKGTGKDRIEILLQIPFSFLFASFIDINMYLLDDISANKYIDGLAILGTGLVLQATGVVLELKPNVAIMSAEGFVKYAARRWNIDFGKMKMRFDIALVLSAIILSLLLTRRVDGVREGTLIAAIVTGYAVSFLGRYVLTRRNAERIKALLTHRH